MARLRGIALAAAGLGLMAAAVAWDYYRGADAISFGRGQQAGFAAGVALVVAGLWHGWLRRPGVVPHIAGRLRGLQRYRALIALALSLAATLIALQLPAAELASAAAWLAWCYIGALCLLLPLRLGLQLLVALALLNLLLAVISTLKTELTGLPLMMLDLEIALAHPAGLWEALDLPSWTQPAAYGALALVVLYLLHEAWVATRQSLAAHGPRGAALRASGHVLCGVAIVALAIAPMQRLFEQLRAVENAWDTVGVATIAKSVGVLPYLAYSKQVEGTQTGDYFRTSQGETPPPHEEIRAAVERFVDFEARSPVLPNIVILLAESTFDPNLAFRLDRPVQSSLFSAGEGTVATGPFRVNVFGGGTWVTEFETITGLDSRLFGYSGYYAHSSLAPYVARSLFTHLEAQGYRSAAFFPNTGEFYNYRNAYRYYGADRILDNRDQGHPGDWLGTDTEVVADFMRVMGPEPEGPFLSYVLSIENHGPHDCRGARIEDMPVRFAGLAAHEPNCRLHEYLRHLASTEAAVAALIAYLRDLEERQGRPYVLAIFGDHQPFSFSGGDEAGRQIDAMRTGAPINQTFYQLVSSAPRRIRCCLGEIPATLLPTLVSAYAVGSPDQVYLGVNLWLYERCGPDAVRSGLLAGLIDTESQPAPGGAGARQAPQAPAACAESYKAALESYRQSGIFAASQRAAR